MSQLEIIKGRECYGDTYAHRVQRAIQLIVRDARIESAIGGWVAIANVEGTEYRGGIGADEDSARSLLGDVVRPALHKELLGVI